MHELSLANALVRTVERHADGHTVAVIAMRVGALRQVATGSLELYVEIVGRGTVCEGATLEIEHVPAVLRCCGEWEAPPFRCPTCGSAGAIIAGEEFEVESIEIEEDECIALT